MRAADRLKKVMQRMNNKLVGHEDGANDGEATMLVANQLQKSLISKVTNVRVMKLWA